MTQPPHLPRTFLGDLETVLQETGASLDGDRDRPAALDELHTLGRLSFSASPEVGGTPSMSATVASSSASGTGSLSVNAVLLALGILFSSAGATSRQPLLKRCRTAVARCYTNCVPTTKPRYTFTDTGAVQDLLDAAQRRWPEIADRKTLLLRLAEEGRSVLAAEDQQRASEARRQRVQTALTRIPSLVDAEVLLSDRAWS